MPGRTPLSHDEIDEALKVLDGWSFSKDRIEKTFEFGDFRAAMGFMVRLGFEAEELNHHPTLTNTYNEVSVALNTHDAGGKVTEMDVTLAKKIDTL